MTRYRHGQFADLFYAEDEEFSGHEVIQVEECISDDEIVVRFLDSNDTITVSSKRLGMPFGTPCQH